MVKIKELLKMMTCLIRQCDKAARIKLVLCRNELRRAITKQLVVKQQASTERALIKSLIPLFVDQVESMAGKLRELAPEGKGAEQQAEVLVRQIFYPAEWNDDLVARTLPVMARKMAEAMVAQLLELGIDVRRKRAKSVKQTSATSWLDDHDGSAELLDEMLLESGQPLGVLTEIPLWMKQEISNQLKATYAQPYWRNINLTTAGDAERVLNKGLREGWSIRKMADQMSVSFDGSTAKYAKMRATRIARTESGNALGGARKAAGDKLKEEMGPQVPMKQSWLSVLADTTRIDHANLDGVPEDDQGLWNLGGISVPWPAHYSLEAGQRCNCMCTLTTEFGMEDAEARQLISEHEERLAE